MPSRLRKDTHSHGRTEDHPGPRNRGGALEAARILRTLGLRKIRQSVIREDTPQTRGLLKVVHHLVEVEEVSQ